VQTDGQAGGHSTGQAVGHGHGAGQAVGHGHGAGQAATWHSGTTAGTQAGTTRFSGLTLMSRVRRGFTLPQQFSSPQPNAQAHLWRRTSHQQHGGVQKSSQAIPHETRGIVTVSVDGTHTFLPQHPPSPWSPLACASEASPNRLAVTATARIVCFLIRGNSFRASLLEHV
jgi:hypothetical protein